MNRLDIIKPLIKDKKVLDIGSAGFKNDNYFFKFVRSNANVTGLEYNKRLVNKYKKDGLIYGNAENYVSKNKFDVVLAGELIEHLSNPGNFLDCSKKNLKSKGTLILTTPNPYSSQNLFRFLISGREAKCLEHVTLFSELTLRELLIRHGFKNLKFYYVHKDSFLGFKGYLERFLGFIKFLRPRIVVIATN